MEIEQVELVVGCNYPIALNEAMRVVGSVAGSANLFLAGNNFIQIGLPNPTEADFKAFSEGSIEAGYIYDHPALVLYFNFGDLIFECPYDVTLIPKDLLEVPNKMNNETRLLLNFHFIDTITHNLFYLRSTTLDKDMSSGILDAVMSQRANFSKDQYNKRLDKIRSLPLEVAFHMSNPLVMGN